jgi:CRISPR-associated protein Cmr6
MPGQIAESKRFEGNFGLYFNKLTDLDTTTWKAFEQQKGGALERIAGIYKRCSEKADVREQLERLHRERENLKASFAGAYTMLTLRAKLSSRLVTGLGQTHPTETGMVFDHNLGIPYIPAASIKGLVRFAHELAETDREMATNIFGGTQSAMSQRGAVIFLDAYPEYVPNLELDIMTPHFGHYYKDGSKDWPTDTNNPVPVKFLTVAAGVTFRFEALIPKQKEYELLAPVQQAYTDALVYEGVGAKTAVGYGRFKIVAERTAEAKAQKQENAANKPSAPAKPENATQVNPHPVGSKDYFLFDLKESEKGIIDQRFLEWRDNDQLNTDAELARLFWNKIDLRNAKGKINKRAKYILTICPDLKNSIDG